MRRFVFTLLFLTLMAGTASASISATGPGGAIPDNESDIFTSDIVIGASETITDVSITINGFSHTWVGELIVTLSGPGGTMDIMRLTGDVDGIIGGSNDSSDVGGDYTFEDGGDDWWAAAAATGSTDPIPPGTYGATSGGVGGIPTASSFVSTFAGTNTAGTWTLSIYDSDGPGDVGEIFDWDLNITSFVSGPLIPEPTTIVIWSVMGGLGLAFGSRRKKVTA